MKENSINNERSSIEKDIHLLESYAGMTHKMTDNQGRPKLDQAIERVLLDYKRVLKENEKYKRLSEMNLKDAEEFKDNMCEHRCLLKSENKELEEKIEKQENIIKNALYIINKDEKEKIDKTWLYNFDKCAILKGDNK